MYTCITIQCYFHAFFVFFSAGDGEIKAWRWGDLKSKVTAGAIKTAE